MTYKARENIFDKFFKHRGGLIQQFKKGDISKKEYIEAGFAYIHQEGLKPFKNVDSFEKAMYNYQFYNTMAKYFYLKSNEIKSYGKHPELLKEHLEKVDYYYRKKDQATLRAIELLDYYGVEAYYIQVQSSYLKKKLYEIQFEDYPDYILHSTSEWLLKRLQEENIFKEGVRRSLISNYVNEKY